MLEPKSTSSLHYHCAPMPQSRLSAPIFKPPHHVPMPHRKHPLTSTLSTTPNPLIYYALSPLLPHWELHSVLSGAAPSRLDLNSFKSIYLMNLSSHLMLMPQYKPQTHLHLPFCLKRGAHHVSIGLKKQTHFQLYPCSLPLQFILLDPLAIFQAFAH